MGGEGKGKEVGRNKNLVAASNTFVAHEIHVRSSHMELPIPTFGNINMTRMTQVVTLYKAYDHQP